MTAPIRPTEVQVWSRCPQLWWYTHVQGWEPPSAAWSPERLLGSVVHLGIATYWKSLTEPQLSPTTALRALLHTCWPEDAPAEYSYLGMEAIALKMLEAALKWIAKTLVDVSPRLIEHSLGPDGHTTPDLVTREPIGLVVTDWKTSLHCESDRIHYKLKGIERDHQFLHYAWAVGEYLHEPVRLIRRVQIVGTPKTLVRAAEFEPTSEMLAAWQRSADAKWGEMAAMRERVIPVYRREEGCLPYGDRYPCPMYEACWTCHGDEAQMNGFYTRKELR